MPQDDHVCHEKETIMTLGRRAVKFESSVDHIGTTLDKLEATFGGFVDKMSEFLSKQGVSDNRLDTLEKQSGVLFKKLDDERVAREAADKEATAARQKDNKELLLELGKLRASSGDKAKQYLFSVALIITSALIGYFVKGV